MLMYTRTEYRNVEPICYEDEHIRKVVAKIKENFPGYFERFLETEGGVSITANDFEKLQKNFGVNSVKDTRKKNYSEVLRSLISDSQEEYEKDRPAYLKIFDMESLEEYEEGGDAPTFKSDVLRSKCPIIRKTLNSINAKELEKYRTAFGLADADYLLQTVINLCSAANDYILNSYDPKTYENIADYRDLNMKEFDSDECTAYGVIGGGIKTLMLHKYDPETFSSRSRSALWALWYLTDKETFELSTDSEFLMIDIGKVITQQNYFYPYELFHYYAFEVYKLIKAKADELNVYINPAYRYVIVDRFLEYVASEHADAIATMQSQIRDNVGDAYA